MNSLYELARQVAASRVVGLSLLTSGGTLFIATVVLGVIYPEPYRVLGFLKYCLEDQPDGRHLTEGCQNIRFLVARDLGNPVLVDWVQTAGWLPLVSVLSTFVGLGLTLFRPALRQESSRD